MFLKFYHAVRCHAGTYTPPQDKSNENKDFPHSERRVTTCV